MVQSPFSALTGFFNKKSNLLKTRVVIHAYNHHVRLLSPESLVVRQPSLLGSRSRHCYAIMCFSGRSTFPITPFVVQVPRRFASIASRTRLQDNFRLADN